MWRFRHGNDFGDAFAEGEQTPVTSQRYWYVLMDTGGLVSVNVAVVAPE